MHIFNIKTKHFFGTQCFLLHRSDLQFKVFYKIKTLEFYVC